MKQHLLGFDIGGTKCAVILGRVHDDTVDILERVAFATETSRGPEYALTRLAEVTQQLLPQHNLTTADIRAIGISCGGPLDSRRGVILGPPNLPGWDEVYITARYEKALGIPTYVQNDANACALAEWKWGAGRGCRHMIFLTFGTGLGAGLILDGKLYLGANELSGEVGHIRLADDGPVGYGKAGSFEGFCSGAGIATAARRVITKYRQEGKTVGFFANDRDIRDISARLIAEAMHDGDPVAREIYETTARYLGRGLAMLIDTLNPERIVIGGIFARQHDVLWPVAHQVILEEALTISANTCQVLPAQLGEAIGDYASLSVAMHE